LLLQPLVENAMRHGIGRRALAGRLTIRAERAGDRLVIRVEDDGPGPGESSARGRGVGLTNTRQRLATLYGDAGALLLEPAAAGGAVATVMLPLHQDPPA
jgi:sensor histidine kinase YesM